MPSPEQFINSERPYSSAENFPTYFLPITAGDNQQTKGILGNDLARLSAHEYFLSDTKVPSQIVQIQTESGGTDMPVNAYVQMMAEKFWSSVDAVRDGSTPGDISFNRDMVAEAFGKNIQDSEIRGQAFGYWSRLFKEECATRGVLNFTQEVIDAYLNGTYTPEAGNQEEPMKEAA